ncbi:MAG: rhodanese-like domain-containing protein [Dehalococcoidales bacterium]
MKKPLILIALLLSLLVLASVTGGCNYITGAALVPSIVSPLSLPPFSDITPQQAYGFLMLSSVQTRVLDVRTPTEYAAGHVPSATNIDFSAPNFKEQISLLDRNARYAVYCLSGVRSAMARKVMQELGFKYVLNITGGFSAWVAAGLPVEK